MSYNTYVCIHQKKARKFQCNFLTTSLAASTGGGLRGSPKNTISGGTTDWCRVYRSREVRQVQKVQFEYRCGSMKVNAE
jgi:hypothetical protein